MATLRQLQALRNNPNVKKFLDLLAYTEGTQKNGYHTAFGGGRLASLDDHPRYLKSFKQTNGKTNKTSAAGRYQFLRSTWDNLAKQYGLSDFGAVNQDLGAIALLAQNGALPHILNGNWGQAVAKAGGTWASLPSSPHPQPTKSWRKVNEFLGGYTPMRQSETFSSGITGDALKSILPDNLRHLLPKSVQSPQDKPLFFGDSIAHGYKNANKATGTTQVGASPKQVLAQLQATLKKNPNALRGQNVVLSSGLSNGNDIASVQQQLELLNDAGANVQLLGVSNSFNVGGRKGQAMNDQLAGLAQNYGASFGGGFVAGKDNVHPKSYSGFLPKPLPQSIARPKPTNQQRGQMLLAGIMGDYKLKDTGIGSGDHFDLRMASKNGVRGDVNPYLNRFLVNGKGLDTYKQTGRYMEQRKGYKHQGVDYGLNGSFGGDANARKLFINPDFGVKNINSFFDKNGGGWVTQVHFDDDAKVNILHQNESGAKEVVNAWGAYRPQQTQPSVANSGIAGKDLLAILPDSLKHLIPNSQATNQATNTKPPQQGIVGDALKSILPDSLQHLL